MLRGDSKRGLTQFNGSLAGTGLSSKLDPFLVPAPLQFLKTPWTWTSLTGDLAVAVWPFRMLWKRLSFKETCRAGVSPGCPRAGLGLWSSTFRVMGS